MQQNSTRSHSRVFRIMPWVICGLGAIFYTYEYFLRISPSVMSSDLMHTYNLSAEAFGNLAAFYYYSYTPMQLPVGLLMDRYGPRRLLAIACLLCAIGSYLFAGSGYLAVAGFGRFLVGFGSAFAFVGVLKLATIWLPANRFALVSGLTAALGTLGAMFGDIALSSMVTRIGWRTTVLITAVAGIIIALAILLIVRDRSKDVRALDKKLGQADMIETLLGLWVIVKKPQIWLNGAIGCLLYLPSTAFAELWGIPYFKTAYAYSSHQAALATSAVFLGFTIGAPIFGWISDKLKNRRLPMAVGGTLSAICLLVVLFVPGLSEIAVYIMMFFFGFNYGGQVIVFAVGRELSSLVAAGTAIAVTNFVVMVGGIVYQPLIGALLDLGWTGEIVKHFHVYSAHDYTWALAVIPASMLVGVCLIYFLKETRCQSQEDR